MTYNFKNIENENIVEMKENLFENLDTINKLIKSIESLKLGYNTNMPTQINEQNTENNINTLEQYSEEEKENTLLDEINYYYLRIKEFDLHNNNENINELKKELPSKRKENFYNIILGINTFLTKDINEIREFIENEKSIISIEELEEFKNDIKDIQKKINAILSINNTQINPDNDIPVDEEPLNNIVFLETETGKTYALEDLDNNRVPNEYYLGFYDLIVSIQDGTFKNVKFLTSGNYKTAGISEVKGFKKRVIFDRVGYDTYVIIGAFTKKSDKDKSYLEPLKRRIAIYRKNRDYIVKMVKEKQGYLEEQKEILNQLYDLLNPNIKMRV